MKGMTSMILKSLYLSDTHNLPYIINKTELSLDEIEHLVGRFSNISGRAGQLRGEYIETPNRIIIRHHFSKKVVFKKIIE